MNALEVRGLSKTYPAFTLKNVSFDVPQGAVVGFIGRNGAGRQVAAVSKELFHWTDTYVIDVADERDALYALMVVLAIDAEKCSRN